MLVEYRRAPTLGHSNADNRGAAISRVGTAMERSNMNLASSLSRERTAALERALDDRRRHAERGNVLAPGTHIVNAIARLGVWLRGVAARPRGTTSASVHRHRKPLSHA